jgi:hypothetical protein
MAVVDDQTRDARKPQRGPKCLAGAASVLVLALITLVVVPMVRPVSFFVGDYFYWVWSGQQGRRYVASPGLQSPFR